MAMSDHIIVANNFKILNNKELLEIVGGASLSLNGTVIRYLTSAIGTVLDVGRSLGTAIRRMISNNICIIK